MEISRDKTKIEHDEFRIKKREKRSHSFPSRSINGRHAAMGAKRCCKKRSKRKKEHTRKRCIWEKKQDRTSLRHRLNWYHGRDIFRCILPLLQKMLL